MPTCEERQKSTVSKRKAVDGGRRCFRQGFLVSNSAVVWLRPREFTAACSGEKEAAQAGPQGRPLSGPTPDHRPFPGTGGGGGRAGHVLGEMCGGADTKGHLLLLSNQSLQKPNRRPSKSLWTKPPSFLVRLRGMWGLSHPPQWDPQAQHAGCSARCKPHLPSTSGPGQRGSGTLTNAVALLEGPSALRGSRIAPKSRQGRVDPLPGCCPRKGPDGWLPALPLLPALKPPTLGASAKASLPCPEPPTRFSSSQQLAGLRSRPRLDEGHRAVQAGEPRRVFRAGMPSLPRGCLTHSSCALA